VRIGDNKNMHEYHKAVEWVEKANAEAAAAGAAKVAALKVTFGEASDYSPEVVKNYFDEAAVGTACEGARFDVTISRCMLKCPKCGKLFEKQLLKYDCPDCGVEGNPTDSGNEVELNGVELA
jgi:hydrogenase nickel incorporation protein HypA/HybF